ncbi:MAG: LicD family protein [Candidatus Cloacimonetes bacterium]|nr:LicD family protein [Candidatus Cloacimonadota bacterium]
MIKIEKFKKKIFRDTIKILRKNGIPHWLESGTLLGIIRDKKNIVWHKEIDLGIPGKYLNNFLSLRKEFSPKYIFMEYPNYSGRNWIDGNTAKIAILSRWKISRSALKVLVSLKYKKDNKYHWVDNKSCKWVDSKFFDNFDKININDIEYYIPSDVENYLYERYGNWKLPQRIWFSGIDDLSIVEDNIIKDVPTIKEILETKEHSLALMLWNKIKPFGQKKIQLTHSDYLVRMKEMLFDTLDILEKNNIRYWIDAGTLLGIFRNGDLLPWDYDADIGIISEYTLKVLNILHKYFPKYLIRKKITNNPWLPGNIRVIKIQTPWEKLRRINFHIDLFCVYKVGNYYRWIDNDSLKQVDQKYYDNLDTIAWEGRKIPIPYNVEKYLRIRYGNWSIPDKNYNASLHDGAIAEKGF